jgi:hypothetical protein
LGEVATQVAGATAVGPVLFGVQEVVTQLLPTDADDATHDATPVGPVVMAAGQVIVTKLLAAAAVCGVHVATGCAT